MHLKKTIPPLTSSKIGFRTFLVTLKYIIQNYNSCITDTQHDFEKRKHLANTLKQILKPPSSYDYDVINDFCSKFCAVRGDTLIT